MADQINSNPEPKDLEESKDDRPQDDDSSQEDGENGDQNYHFYKEYCRLYYANIILTNRLQQLLNEKQDLNYKLNSLEEVPFCILINLCQNNKRKHEDVLGLKLHPLISLQICRQEIPLGWYQDGKIVDHPGASRAGPGDPGQVPEIQEHPQDIQEELQNFF